MPPYRSDGHRTPREAVGLSALTVGERELEKVENARFVAERPRSMALLEQAQRSMPRGVPMAWMDDLYEHPPVWVSHGEGSSFTDVDGHTNLDMYVADMSAFCGHAPRPVVQAVARRMKLGNQFLLPGEDAIVVAEHLASRYAGLAQAWGLEPDFLTLGKALAAGVPLATYGMRDEIAR